MNETDTAACPVPSDEEREWKRQWDEATPIDGPVIGPSGRVQHFPKQDNTDGGPVQP